MFRMTVLIVWTNAEAVYKLAARLPRKWCLVQMKYGMNGRQESFLSLSI